MSSLRTAVSLLIGTVVGAGFLAIPYTAARAGFLFTLAHIAVIGSAVCLLTLYLAEITFRTKKNHQLPGYAERYLGASGRFLMLVATITGIYSALTAYLIAHGQSLSFLITGSTEHALPALLIAWLVFACVSHRRTSVGKSETLGVSLMILLMLVIIFIYGSRVQLENLATISLKNILLPFGVVLFAFLGFSAIPEMKIQLSRHPEKIKRTIIVSYLLIAVLYATFTLVVFGTHGEKTPEIATFALGRPFVLLGLVTLSTAYLALTLALIDTLTYDCRISHRKSWLLANFTPLALVLLLASIEKASFTLIISIGGIISGTITALLILLMLPRARRHGDFRDKAHKQAPYTRVLAWILALIFIAGSLAELIALLS